MNTGFPEKVVAVGRGMSLAHEEIGDAATVRAITGARLETIPGMGHDLPKGAWPRLLDLIDDHTRATRSTDAPTS